MRELGTIQTINNLENIPNKDKIKLASFKSIGWKVIVDLDIKINDKVIFFEPDTILPIKPEFEFLRKRCFNEDWNGFRIKRMKMASVLSEGICFPISILGNNFKKIWSDGKDITNLIGAIKYDPELREEQSEANKKKKYPWWMRILFRIPFLKKIFLKKTTAPWPFFISKTDETRIQNLCYLFDNSTWRGMPLVASEKVDGQSGSFALVNNEFWICSRNMVVFKGKVGSLKKLKDKSSKFIQTAEKYDIENILVKYQKKTGCDIYIQGEQMGPGIQKNKYGFTELKLFVFNIRTITKEAISYWNNSQIHEFCLANKLDMVPVLDNLIMPDNMDALVELSKGQSKLADIPREGIVLRSVETKQPEIKMSNMFSFKVINPDFLVKYGLE